MKRLLWFGLFGLLACGGGGGGGGGTPAPTPPPTGPSSVALEATAPTSGIFVQRGGGSGGTRLEVEVRAVEVSGVFGLAFDLVFPANLLSYQGFAEGDFLGADGAETSLQVSDTGSGRLIVGATRLGQVGAMTGSGVVVTLVFQATTIGTGALSFQANEAIGGVGEEVTLTWSGGTVRVTG
ncbi:MAG: cohesin domain-containing protein [Acidobacteriota bacterium]